MGGEEYFIGEGPLSEQKRKSKDKTELQASSRLRTYAINSDPLGVKSLDVFIYDNNIGFVFTSLLLLLTN